MAKDKVPTEKPRKCKFCGELEEKIKSLEQEQIKLMQEQNETYTRYLEETKKKDASIAELEAVLEEVADRLPTHPQDHDDAAGLGEIVRKAPILSSHSIVMSTDQTLEIGKVSEPSRWGMFLCRIIGYHIWSSPTDLIEFLSNPHYMKLCKRCKRWIPFTLDGDESGSYIPTL